MSDGRPHLAQAIPALVSVLLVTCGPSVALDLGLYVTDTMDEQTAEIKPLGGQFTTTAHLFATPGEYEPVSFTVRPLERVVRMFMTAGPLTGPAGTIAADRVRVQSVEGFHGGDRDLLMDLGRPWDMPAYRRERFWVTVHVPDNAASGTYRGAVRITSNGEPVGQLGLELEVLPFTLADPPYALGLNYSNPQDPAALEAHLRDMREHGMTTVAPLYQFHLPIYDEDTGELAEFIAAYQAAGYSQPMYLATPMNLTTGALLGYGPVDSRRFQRKYLQVMRRLQAETSRHQVPVIYSIGDEFTNKALPGVEYGEKLARFVYEELPEFCVTSDMNGYLEVMRMAPYLNVAAVNNGWDGMDGHNQGRRLINRETLLEIGATGAIPWFVNAGTGRFPYGFFFWKMAQYGVRGKVEWYYNLGDNESGSVVRVEGARVWPTLAYERSREGVDDLRYVCRLEALLVQAEAAGVPEATTKPGRDLLQRIGESIVDNWTAYTEGGERFPPEGPDLAPEGAAGTMGPYQAIRWAIAQEIERLQEARGA